MLPYLFVQELLSDSKSYRASLNYHQQDLVKEIIVHENGNGYAIEGIVTVYDIDFCCRMELDLTGHLLAYKCNCDSSHAHGPCAHIGAIFLKLNDLEVDHFPFYYQRDRWAERFFKERENFRIKQELAFSQDFLTQKKEKYALQLASQLSLEKYQLKPILKISEENKINLEYRIGNEKTYIVRSISTLLDNIDGHNEANYGKKLQFVHSMDAFTNEAKRHILFMRKACEVHKRLRERKSNYIFGQADYLRIGRSIEVVPELYEDFYITYASYSFKNFGFRKASYIELQIIEKESYYVLEMISALNSGYLTTSGYYVLAHSEQTGYVLTCYPVDENHNVSDLVQMFVDHEVMIAKADFTEFYKYVLKPIEKYIYIRNLPQVSTNRYDQIIIYGDVNENGRIEFQLYYADDDKNRITGFNNTMEKSYEQDLVEQAFRLYTTLIDEKHGKAYFDTNDERTYAFIQERLPFLENYAEIYVTDALKKLGQQVHYQIQVGIRVENDLLSVNIDSTEIPQMEIVEVLAKYQKKQKFHRLKSGTLISLDSPELEELTHFMERYHVNVNEVQNGQFKLQKNRMFSLADEQENYQLIRIGRDSSFNHLLNGFDTKVKSYNLSEHYEHVLRDYQKVGYQWLRTLHDYGLNGILADDMGLGKTLQVICLLDHIEHALPSLVVCPSSLVYNWEDEVKHFAKDLVPWCIIGDQTKRQRLLQDDLTNKLLLTSYDYLRRDIDFYQDLSFEYVILDESQYIKNQNTKNARAVKQLRGKHKLALSGTPIENSLAELWSIFDFLMPQYLFNYHYFRQKYEIDIVKKHDEQKIIELRKMVSPFILRRHKKDVLKELPDKIEMKHLIPFTKTERELYYACLAQVNHQLQSLLDTSASTDQVAILAMLTRLRQICCEPRLVFENINQPSSKMNACLDLVNTYKKNNQKVLIFSSFTSLFDLLEPELRQNGVSFFKLTGQTSKEKRHEAVSAFQNGQADVFLISLKAGGTGLNLTRAEAVIHFDPWWNMSSQNQATDRAYRLGQTHSVQVHQLIMKESVEEKIMNLQEKKKELADLFVEESEGNISSLSKEEILELFRL